MVAMITIPVFGGGGPLNPDLKTHKKSLQKWLDLRFGLSIHWGPVAMRGTEIGWSRGREVPIEEYDRLYKEFDPVLYDANEWVSLMQEAGMKYITFVAKHHDGFTLWDSAHTDYDITATPHRRDMLKELADACRRGGIMFGTYYSIIDWYQYDYVPRYRHDPRPTEGANMDRYVAYLKNQVQELIEKYDTDIFIFDGQWNDTWTPERGRDLYRHVRRLKNAIVVNTRVDQGGDLESNAGDFVSSEQYIPRYQESPWESWITLGDQWAWKANDTNKSAEVCIRMLLEIVGGNGNFNLNVTPMPDGRFEGRQKHILRTIGAWLKKNGASIYGTRGGPFLPTRNFVSTRKENRVYLHLMDGKPEVFLPGIKRKIEKAALLNGRPVRLGRTDKGVWIKPEKSDLDKLDTIVVLTLDGSAMELDTVPTPSSLELGKYGKWISRDATYVASSLSAENNKPQDNPKLLNGESLEAEYSFSAGREPKPYIVIDLQRTAQINAVEIVNRYGRRSRDARTLTLWISQDKENWKQVWSARDATSGVWRVIRDIVFADPEDSTQQPLKARYVKLGLNDERLRPFCLRSVKVYGQ